MLELIGVLFILVGVAYLVVTTALPVRMEKKTDPFVIHTHGEAERPDPYHSIFEPLMRVLPERIVRAYRGPVDKGKAFTWSNFLDRQFALLLIGLGISLLLLSNPILVVVGMFIPPVIHYGLTFRKAKAYEAKFLNQLPNALLLIASAIAAGRNFVNALEATTPNLAEPLKTELALLAQQTQSLRMEEVQAFEMWADRLPYPELHTVASALAIGNKIGLETYVLLRNLADSIQAEIRGRQELQAVTSQVRTTATVVSFLPFAFLLVIYFIVPGFVTPLVTTIAGGIILGIVILLNWGSRIITKQMLERIEI
jgi:tight adherence protein B